MLSVIAIFFLARIVSARLASLLAALLLGYSPIFITYSSLVMSDVPTLFVTICAAVMLVVATSNYVTQSSSWMRMAAWLMFGLLAGFSTIIRPTNAVILVGLALCVVMVPLERRDLASLFKAALAIAIGFAIPVAWQLHQNSLNLGERVRQRIFVVGAGGLWRRRQDVQHGVPIRSDDAAKSARQRDRVPDDAARTRRDARRSRQSALLPVPVRSGGIRDCRVHRDLSRAGKVKCATPVVVRARLSRRAHCALLLLPVHRRGLHPSRCVHPVHCGGLRGGGGESIYAPGIQEP